MVEGAGLKNLSGEVGAVGSNPTIRIMDTFDRGDATEAQILSRLKELGFTVLEPFGDNKRYDYVVEKKGEFCRIQVKTISDGEKEGRLRAYLKNMNPRNNDHKYYDRDSIDAFAFYSPKYKECYWLDKSKAPKTCVTFAKEYKQKQENMRLAEDYIITSEIVNKSF